MLDKRTRSLDGGTQPGPRCRAAVLFLTSVATSVKCQHLTQSIDLGHILERKSEVMKQYHTDIESEQEWLKNVTPKTYVEVLNFSLSG